MAAENLGDVSRANAAQAATFSQSIQETQDASKTLDTALAANSAEASQETLQSESESTINIMIKTQKLVMKQELKTKKAERAQESVLVRKEDADGLSGEFSQRQGNREYHLDPQILSQLAEDLGRGINANSDPADIIANIYKLFTVDKQNPDASIVDKAFEFLLETTANLLKTANETDKPALQTLVDKLNLAKSKHFEANTDKIQVAQKIIGAVDAVIAKTGESVKATLDQYRDVVHNPPDLQTLRKFYEGKGFKIMVLELKGLNSFLGGNFKRTNLDNPELMQLAAAARKMQALLGVFRQSKIHIPTVESFLELNGILYESEEEAANLFKYQPESFYKEEEDAEHQKQGDDEENGEQQNQKKEPDTNPG